MGKKVYAFQARIEPVPGKGGAYVRFPYDVRQEFKKGRVSVEATFDGIPYRGSLVNMVVINADGSFCHILGIRKDIREKIGKQPGDQVQVMVREVEPKEKPQMWTCPRCGKKFSKRNQSHYCGSAPKNIDEYIRQQPETVQAYLRQMNAAIRSAIPGAEERISWSMPTYWRKRNLIQFAASKKHLGLYPGPEAVSAFSEQLQEYETSKGTIRFPYDQPLPLALIGEIARWCWDKYGDPSL